MIGNVSVHGIDQQNDEFPLNGFEESSEIADFLPLSPSLCENSFSLFDPISSEDPDYPLSISSSKSWSPFRIASPTNFLPPLSSPTSPPSPLPSQGDYSTAKSSSEPMGTIPCILSVSNESNRPEGDQGQIGGPTVALAAPPKKRHKIPLPASTADALFRVDALESSCSENPNASLHEILAIVGKKWESLGDEAKKPFQLRAQLDQIRYENELIGYTEYLKRRRRKHPDAPKHPMPAYLHFVRDHRAKLTAAFPEKKPTDIARILGEEWRKLSPNRKAHYEFSAREDKVRYQKEKAHFQSNSKKNLDKEIQKDPLMPKYPLSSYLHFLELNRSQVQSSHPEKNLSEITKLLAERWRKMPKHEKRKYEVLAFADKCRYNHEKKNSQAATLQAAEQSKATLVTAKVGDQRRRRKNVAPAGELKKETHTKEVPVTRPNKSPKHSAKKHPEKEDSAKNENSHPPGKRKMKRSQPKRNVRRRMQAKKLFGAEKGLITVV